MALTAQETWVDYEATSTSKRAAVHALRCTALARRGDSLTYPDLIQALNDYWSFRPILHDCISVDPAEFLYRRRVAPVLKIGEVRIIRRKGLDRCDGCFKVRVLKYGFAQPDGGEIELCVPCKTAAFGDGSGRAGDIITTAAQGGLPTLGKRK